MKIKNIKINKAHRPLLIAGAVALVALGAGLLLAHNDWRDDNKHHYGKYDKNEHDQYDEHKKNYQDKKKRKDKKYKDKRANKKHKHDQSGHAHKHEKKHPIGYADNEEEVHVHSDWLIHLAGVTLDLSADKYQTTNTQELHKHIHLHDNNGLVIHRHANNITLAEFLTSLGFAMSDTCLTTDEGVHHCANETEKLMVYVNEEAIANPSAYVNQEADRILVYYGDPNDQTTIAKLQAEVSDQACIYSGTCPERGTPPPEACGLNCEL